MVTVPLRLGPLVGSGYTVHRSGIRWLHEEGYLCRPGEPIAYCSISLERSDGPPNFVAFVTEFRDLQVAFAPRLGGRLRKSEHSSRGGYLDQNRYWKWNPDFVIGHIDCSSEDVLPDRDDATEPRLLMLAGRRATELAEARSGLLTGWHDRSRAWWGEGKAPGTVVSMGNCEQVGVIRGERQAYLEMFELAPGPAHVVHYMNEPLIPCAAVLIEQLRRTPAESEAIAADLAHTLPAGPTVPTPADWMFAGALLAGLQRSPLTDLYPILTRNGFQSPRRADAVILSITCEDDVLLRHRELGYTVSCHGFRIAETGTAVRAWLREKFEPVRRTLADIRRSYDELIAVVREQSAAKILVMNRMSAAAGDVIYNYAPFDAPLAQTLTSIYAKEIDLMLHELAREHGIAIIDVDAIAAELGARWHIPDGMHQSGPLQGALRGAIVRILGEQGVPGFAGARLS